MRRFLLAIFCVILLGWAAQYYRLYLKDGGFHSVREHKVVGDRVSYYSVERGDWEEIPIDLVDLKKTDRELASRAESSAEERKLIADEAAAEREIRRIIASIPDTPGVYKLVDNKPQPLKIAESTLVTDKKRQALKILSPIPIIAGKSTVELAGESSGTAYSERRPEFFIRLSKVQQFALVQLMPSRKGARIVETIQIIPVSKERLEERKELEIFRQELEEGLYKIWPQADLTAGEYAWIEFTEGEGNLQIWDFKIQ